MSNMKNADHKGEISRHNRSVSFSRLAVRVLASLLLSVVTLCAFSQQEDPGDGRPNVILIMAGYATFIAGKWQLSANSVTPGDDPYQVGFDRYCLWQLEPASYWSRYKNPVIVSNGDTVDVPGGAYGPDIMTDSVCSFIEEYAGEPFFMYYPMCLPHAPFQPTPDHPEYETHPVKGTNKTEYFDDMVHYLDKLVGRIADKLDEQGIREESVLIFTGDNGTHRRISSRMEDGSIIQGGKGLPTEAGTHVPMIVSWEGTIVPGGVYSGLFGFTDFLPTLADLFSAPLPDGESFDGISFYPLFRGESQKEREWIYCYYHSGKDHLPSAEYVHGKKWKLYENGAFYDIQEDPNEKHPFQHNELPGKAEGIKEHLQSVLDSLKHQQHPL